MECIEKPSVRFDKLTSHLKKQAARVKNDLFGKFQHKRYNIFIKFTSNVEMLNVKFAVTERQSTRYRI